MRSQADLMVMELGHRNGCASKESVHDSQHEISYLTFVDIAQRCQEAALKKQTSPEETFWSAR